MIDTLVLLDSLRCAGVRLRVIGDTLQVAAPAGLDPLLKERLRDRRAEVLAQLRVLPAERGDFPYRRLPGPSVPVSPAQRRMWFLAQLEGMGSCYHLGYSFHVKGDFDVAVFEQACWALVERHSSLRTTFTERDGIVLQRVASAPHAHFSLIEAAHVPADELAALVYDHLRVPFDLQNEPPFRVHVWRTEECSHVVSIGMHHIVTDGWSKEVLTRELSALYRAFSDGGEPPPSPALEYTDYCLWQEERLLHDRFSGQLAYWVRQLRDAPRLLELPTDFPRPPVQSRRGAARTIQLDHALSFDLRTLASALNLTPFMVLLAGFYLMLARFSQQRDIVVGTPVAGRDALGLEGLIGLMVNTLALRARINGTQSFASFAEHVREACLGAYANQEVPFERIVEALNPERLANHSPVFQAMFTLQNAPQPRMDLPGLICTPMAEESVTAKFDLTVAFAEQGDRFIGNFEYCTDLFAAATIDAMMGEYAAILAQASARPDLSLTEIFTRCARVAPVVLAKVTKPQDIVGLFEAQVLAQPDAEAVRGVHGGLSYGDLNRRANQLARYLCTHGVAPGMRVGLCLQRSVEAVTAMLAVLKAGAAYVPLDPKYPATRLAHMVGDARLAVCVGNSEVPDALLEQGIPVLRLDAAAEALDAYDSDNLGVQANAWQAAYVIYTSGSTGTPKGIVVPHRGVVRLVCEADYVRLGTGTAVAHASTIAFDAATFEIFGALLNGGHLVIVPEDLLLMPEQLAEFLERKRVNVLFTTTALFNQVARHLPSAFEALEILLFGGEFVDPSSVRAVQRACGKLRLLHVYGPTENTTFSTWHPIGKVSEDAVNIPIGTAIARSTFCVLDADGVPVPSGARGELYLGGDGLADGYIGAPDLTAARFLPDPFAAHPGARMYRSGDLVRLRHDGAVEFIGRADDQVKVRGFRIELGEIEAALCGCPQVSEAVVLTSSEAGLGQLIAWLVPTGADRPDAVALHAQLRSRLPDYMLPSRFIWLDSLPLNRNGKVDKQRLPLPAPLPAHAPEGGVGDSVEAELSRIWSAVLGVPVTRVEQNFFDAGGSSLALMNVRSLMRETWPDLSIAVSELFAYPTIASLAHHVRRQQVERADAPVSRAASVAGDVGRRKAALERRKRQMEARRDS